VKRKSKNRNPESSHPHERLIHEECCEMMTIRVSVATGWGPHRDLTGAALGAGSSAMRSVDSIT
jgi:hypothetical protein